MDIYTTSAAVLAELPQTPPASVQSLIAGWITEESQVVDTWLPNYLVPFNDITAPAYPTPAIIERITRFLVLDRVFRNIGLLRYDEAGRVVDSYKVEAERLLRQLRDGELVIPVGQLPP